MKFCKIQNKTVPIVKVQFFFFMNIQLNVNTKETKQIFKNLFFLNLQLFIGCGHIIYFGF